MKPFWRIGFENCAASSGFYEYIGTDIDYGGGIDDDELLSDIADDIIKQCCGEGLNSDIYISYLKDKYCSLYDV